MKIRIALPVLLAATVLSCDQPATKKAAVSAVTGGKSTAPTPQANNRWEVAKEEPAEDEQNGPQAAKTWERSKECATQAEKVMSERRLVVPDGAIRMGVNPANKCSTDEWTNHYSPKYGRCFVKHTCWPRVGTFEYDPPETTELLDAFERSSLAISVWWMYGCRGENPTACQENRRAYPCVIDKQPVDCAKAEAFISEHMKN